MLQYSVLILRTVGEVKLISLLFYSLSLSLSLICSDCSSFSRIFLCWLRYLNLSSLGLGCCFGYGLLDVGEKLHGYGLPEDCEASCGLPVSFEGGCGGFWRWLWVSDGFCDGFDSDLISIWFTNLIWVRSMVIMEGLGVERVWFCVPTWGAIGRVGKKEKKK